MIRPIASFLGAIVICGVTAFAQGIVPQTEPAKSPQISSQAPSSSAANVQQAPETMRQAAAAATILVLPFAPLTSQDHDWISKGVQQDLAADLIRSSRLRVLAPSNAAPAGDSNAGLKAGRDAKASFVVFGHYQVSDSQLRVTGQVLETGVGQHLGALKSTGMLRDLFNVEDSLTAQVLSSLPRQLVSREPTEPDEGPNYVYHPHDQFPAGAASPDQGAPPDTAQSNAPSTPYSSSDYSGYPGSYYSYPQSYYYAGPDYGDYGYNYYYPYGYDWGYPGAGFGFFFDGFRHHRDHDRDWGRNGFRSHSFAAPRMGGAGRFGGSFHGAGGMGGGFHGGGGGHR